MTQPGLQPRVTVCICTRNRPVELQRCLDSLSRSTFAIDEIIVSDDSTDSRTASMLAGTAARITYVEGPKSGLGANRNKALSVASGDYILFLDDDACLGEHFLEQALACARAHAASGAQGIVVTGRELNHGVMVSSHDQSFLGFQRVAYRDGCGLKTIVINSTLFPRALFGFARFDERLVYGYDEVDIALRAVRHGFRIVQKDEAINLHFPSAVNRAYYRPHTDVSRLYVTFRRYALYERAYFKAAGFALLAPAHCLLAAAKSRGLRGVADACRVITSAVRLSVDSLRRRGAQGAC